MCTLLSCDLQTSSTSHEELHVLIGLVLASAGKSNRGGSRSLGPVLAERGCYGDERSPHCLALYLLRNLCSRSTLESVVAKAISGRAHGFTPLLLTRPSDDTA
jgi:hypothetical protein